MPLKPLATIAALGLLVAAAGCGSSDDGDDASAAATPTAATPTTTVAPAAATGDVTIGMTEFAFEPAAATAKSGKVVITAKNDGQVAHELVLLKSDADPANLPKKGGEVDESSSVGEIPDVAAGATKKDTFKLAPGRYVMVCALPGHYEGGMYGTLTVK